MPVRLLALLLVATQVDAGVYVYAGRTATESEGQDSLPTLPLTFTTPYSAPGGSTVNVYAGGNFQTALNNAALGDIIVLEAGATFTGPFTLPNKASGSGWIYVISSALASLPAEGTRVTPADVSDMPKLTASVGQNNILVAADNAHHYRFVGIEIAPTAGDYMTALVRIGDDDESTATLPNNITFDRCYIHGDATVGSRRGVAMDGAYVAIIDSHLSDFKEEGADTQAVWAYNTSGPLKIVNNYLEAAGENIMFGGADSQDEDLVPADIEIRGNHLFKPEEWAEEDWSIKNLIEFKAARRVLFTENTLENSWASGQDGTALLISPKNQDGTAPWSVTEDITITSNLWLNVAAGMRVGGTDSDGQMSERTHRVLVKDNLLLVDGTVQGSDLGRLFSVVGGPVDVVLDHNTGLISSGSLSALMMADSDPVSDRFVFTNNLADSGMFGFKGTGTATGTATLEGHFSNYTFAKNAVIGGTEMAYPANNFFPANTAAVGFEDFNGGDYTLDAMSPYKNAGTDGEDLGADISTVPMP